MELDTRFLIHGVLVAAAAVGFAWALASWQMKSQRRALSVLGLACSAVLAGLLFVTDLAPAPASQAAHAEQTTGAQAITCTEPITVGVMADLTGPLALYGAQIERSFHLGMEYIAGPPVGDDVYMLDDCEIRLVWGDDQSNLAIGDAVARALIEDNGAQILVGTVSSGVTARLQEIAEEYNIVHIAAPAASNDITGINFVPNSFRTSRNNYQDAASICQYLASQPGTLVQIAPDASFGRTTAGFYRDACRYFGAAFAAGDIFAPASTSDFTPYVQQILDSGAGALIVTWAGPGYVPLLQALADGGVVDQMNVALSFPDNASIPTLLNNIVGETGGIVYHYTSPSNQINDWLVSESIARHGLPPDLFAADGMNAALMIAQAITASGGDASADALIAALEGMAFAGPKGTVSIRPEDHVAIQDMYIVRLSNVDDPDSDFFETVTTNRPEPPCLLPTELEDRCGALPVGSLMRPVFLPLVSRN